MHAQDNVVVTNSPVRIDSILTLSDIDVEGGVAGFNATKERFENINNNFIRYTEPITYTIPSNELPNTAGLSGWYTILDTISEWSFNSFDFIISARFATSQINRGTLAVEGQVQFRSGVIFPALTIRHTPNEQSPINGMRLVTIGNRAVVQVRFNILEFFTNSGILISVTQKNIFANGAGFTPPAILPQAIQEDATRTAVTVAPPTGALPLGVTVVGLNVVNQISPLEWLEPVLQNGWTFGLHTPFRYSIDTTGLVSLNGMLVTPANIVNGTVIMSLPANFRPQRTIERTLAWRHNNALGGIAAINILASGLVTIQISMNNELPAQGEMIIINVNYKTR